MGEGGVKNPEKIADVVYGWSLPSCSNSSTFFSQMMHLHIAMVSSSFTVLLGRNHKNKWMLALGQNLLHGCPFFHA